MSTQSEVIPSERPTTLDASLISIFLAIVLGSSLLESNRLLFPPKVTSPSFWALLSVYYCAFSVWFSLRLLIKSRPYTDSPLSRTIVVLQALAIINLTGLLYFASRAVDSLHGYLWSWVIFYFLLLLIYILRYREFRRREPFKKVISFGSLAFIVAVVYSVWALTYPPLSKIAIWIFVLITLGNVVGYRTLLRLQHYFRPEYEERHFKTSKTT
jgi:hypothetical protein